MSDALVVDDDDAIRELVSYSLERDGFSVIGARDVQEALAAVRAQRIDIVLLDVNLPGIDGFGFIERVRRFSRVPIVMLTVRHDEPDIVRALELGADDYVAKPFSPRELLARVHTVIRRSRLDQTVVFRREGVETTIDLSTRQVIRSDVAARVDLTAVEAEILRMLLRSAGRLVPRAILVTALQEGAQSPGSRSLDVHICRLRTKLGMKSVLQTVRGLGYMWADTVEGGYMRMEGDKSQRFTDRDNQTA